MELITSTMRMQASFFTFATMVALFSHSLVIPVMSTSEYYSPKPSTAITPPAGDSPANINCNTPPHGGSGGGGGGSDGHHEPSTPSRSPPSGHHDGGGGSGGYHYSPPPYTPTTPTPTIPTPKTPVVTPTTDPHTTTPSTPNPTPTPTTPTYTPRTPTVAPPTVPHTPAIPIPTTPPSVGTPPFPFPNTPPFSFDPRIPSSSGPFPCTFWRMHPTMIWGIMGWNGNTVSSTFGVGNVGGFGAGMNLLEALSNTRTDGFGELYREGTAALLNSMASNGFPFSAQQVKLSFGRAALSSNGDAAAAQAQLFKMANEGRYKPASP